METVTATPPMRERLLDAATDLFYAQGLRAVSADRIIERVGTTKVTFYRHFRTKDDLVVAYLERRAGLERDGIGQAVEMAAGDPDKALALIAEGIGAVVCGPGYRGCPFINAAAEYPDPDSPVRRVVDTHRRWYSTLFEQIIAPLGRPDQAAVVAQLVLLRDGAMVAGYLGDPAAVADALRRGSRAIIDA
ncbi:TetR/AcrR family transcriptional regulator [Actinoplanes couchii]|uniref:TetR family transcriptional regulator n=1 Tax=Actinoplanes couchii TaxID=403638 RepID=A0ABQ3XL45_9ACTN|nr:TetR/AcrR family transcriptional regulator [Actinoplanes couchii]MDR6318418.1 AcrR family transcriptional regulator [Actinoplanes couchii]GID59216.1 TetR family transcriptional regulator [Actinoplanes couchii]